MKNANSYFLLVSILLLHYSFAQNTQQKVSSGFKKFVVNGELKPIPSIPANYNVKVNDIPPRFQWNGNSGYCGETCMISAGLYYGQYFSQYDVRQYTQEADYCSNLPTCGQADTCQKSQGDQLFPGENSSPVADRLKLKHEKIKTKSKKEFMLWIKRHVVAGHPVMIGVLNNVVALAEYTVSPTWSKKRLDDSLSIWGSQQYDHIVPVFGFASTHPLHQEVYCEDDLILFSDNGIYTPCGNIVCSPFPQKCVPYYTLAKLDTFFKTRIEANEKGIYALPKICAEDKADHFYYGTAITGIKTHADYVPIPVRIDMDTNFEATCNAHSGVNEAADSTCCIYQGASLNQNQVINQRPDTLKTTKNFVTISGLKPGKKYEICRYNNPDCVPADFNKSNIGSPFFKEEITAKSSVHRFKIKISSDEKLIFRVVPK